MSLIEFFPHLSILLPSILSAISSKYSKTAKHPAITALRATKIRSNCFLLFSRKRARVTESLQSHLVLVSAQDRSIYPLFVLNPPAILLVPGRVRFVFAVTEDEKWLSEQRSSSLHSSPRWRASNILLLEKLTSTESCTGS